MQSFIVLASLVFESVGGKNDAPPALDLKVTKKKHLSSLRVKLPLRQGKSRIAFYVVTDLLISNHAERTLQGSRFV